MTVNDSAVSPVIIPDLKEPPSPLTGDQLSLAEEKVLLAGPSKWVR